MVNNQTREFNQQTLGVEDTIIRINSKHIGDVIADIEKDQRLKCAHLTPSYVGAPRYEINFEITPGKVRNAATLVKTNEIYLASFGIIPKRDYAEGSKERETAEIVIGSLKEIFREYA